MTESRNWRYTQSIDVFRTQVTLTGLDLAYTDPEIFQICTGKVMIVFESTCSSVLLGLRLSFRDTVVHPVLPWIVNIIAYPASPCRPSRNPVALIQELMIILSLRSEVGLSSSLHCGTQRRVQSSSLDSDCYSDYLKWHWKCLWLTLQSSVRETTFYDNITASKMNVRIESSRVSFKSPAASHIANPPNPLFFMNSPCTQKRDNETAGSIRWEWTPTLSAKDCTLSYETHVWLDLSYTKGYAIEWSGKEARKNHESTYRLAAIIKQICKTTRRRTIFVHIPCLD